MAIYPKASYRPIPSATDRGIVPLGVVLHVAASEAWSLYDWFNGPSKGIESHFYLRYDGSWEQYRDTEIDADANYMGNAFVRDGVRYGFISVETQGLGSGEWSAEQLREIKAFLQWANKTHGIPLVVTPAWDAPGVGYHTLFPDRWTNVAGKTCPGPKRIAQFNEDIVPWMENGDDMEKIPKPDWLPQSVIDDLVKWRVLTAPPALETLDMWRQLVFIHRAVTYAVAQGGSAILGPFDATITPK